MNQRTKERTHIGAPSIGEPAKQAVRQDAAARRAALARQDRLASVVEAVGGFVMAGLSVAATIVAVLAAGDQTAKKIDRSNARHPLKRFVASKEAKEYVAEERRRALNKTKQ